MNSSLENETHFGLKLTKFRQQTLPELISGSIKERKQIVIHGYAMTMFYLLKQFPGIFEIIQGFDCLICDGRGFYYFMRMLGVKDICKTSLPNLVYIALEIACISKYRVFLLGSTDKNNSDAIKGILNEYGNIEAVNGRGGYFSVEEELDVVDTINSASPDILLVGISTPKKELFLSKHRNKLHVPVIINCGGMLDVLGGNAQLPPRIITIMGLSWLYRVIQEPRRLVTVTLKNGILALLTIVPRTLFERYIRKNSRFSIPKYVKIK